MKASMEGKGGSRGDEGALEGGVDGGVGGKYDGSAGGLGSQRMTWLALVAR